MTQLNNIVQRNISLCMQDFEFCKENAIKIDFEIFIFFYISTDVAEVDPDSDCRSLAVQSLVLLDKSVKKQLQDQQSLALESSSWTINHKTPNVSRTLS